MNMRNTMFVLSMLNTVMGAINLGVYAWGAHEPASLAVGVFCLFVAQYVKPKDAA